MTALSGLGSPPGQTRYSEVSAHSRATQKILNLPAVGGAGRGVGPSGHGGGGAHGGAMGACGQPGESSHGAPGSCKPGGGGNATGSAELKPISQIKPI